MTSWRIQLLPSGSLNVAVREVRAPRTVEARGLSNRYLADVDAATDEIVPGGVDVGYDEDQSLSRPRLGVRAALAELDRAL